MTFLPNGKAEPSIYFRVVVTTLDILTADPSDLEDLARIVKKFNGTITVTTVPSKEVSK